MKKINSFSILLTGVASMLVMSCKNGDAEFPNYNNSSVYFAYQSPVRTLVMGEDTYDTTLDNEHKCQIYATMGGAYSGSGSVVVDVMVDDELCKNLFFDGGATRPVKPMPKNYYSLSSDKIILNQNNNLMGAVDVQFTDDFFNNPESLENTYVIPLRMVGVTNADSILSGVPKTENAAWTNAEMWEVAPKNYVLYCVKYINKWAAKYLRRGVDKITENGNTIENKRHAAYVEDDEICQVSTRNLNTAVFPVSTVVGTNTLTCNLLLSFNENGECTITSDTPDYPASGTGKFVEKGDKNSWGNKDRNVLYLEYNVDFGVRQYQTNDTLVVQTRNIAFETFSPTYKN